MNNPRLRSRSTASAAEIIDAAASVTSVQGLRNVATRVCSFRCSSLTRPAGTALIRRRRDRRERLLGVVVVATSAFAALHFLFDDNLLNPQYAWLLSFMLGGSIAAAWGVAVATTADSSGVES